MNKIEALADALASFNEMQNPKSDAYRLRNPGMLVAFGYRQLQECEKINGKFIRVFSNIVGGYRALWLDIEMKSKHERRGIKGNTLRDLLTTYKAGHDSALFEIIDFLHQALGDEGIQADTDLQYFLEGQ